jgi:threonyl-tRNA synthetase
MEHRSVNVRNRDDVGNKERKAQTIPLDVITAKLVALKADKRLENQLDPSSPPAAPSSSS